MSFQILEEEGSPLRRGKGASKILFPRLFLESKFLLWCDSTDAMSAVPHTFSGRQESRLS